MTKMNAPILSLNAGEVSKDALVRVDLEKMRLAVELAENVSMTVLGGTQFRAGTKKYGTTYLNKKSRDIQFKYSASQMATLEVTDAGLRVWRDETIVTRPSVATTITNGDFSTTLGTGWTNSSGTNSSASVSGGVGVLMAGGHYDTAKIYNAVSVTNTDKVKLHAVRIIIPFGDVICRIGTTNGGDDLIQETRLLTGTHSLAFTPNVNTFYIVFEVEGTQVRTIQSAMIEAAGDMLIPTPWAEADLKYLRTDQSGDVVFVWCRGYQQKRIERRNWDSWSVTTYQSDNGPYLPPNTSRVTLTPSNYNGSITLTASKAFFKSGHVGAIFRISHNKQYQQKYLIGEEQATDPIRVTGVGGDDRRFTIYVEFISGTGTTVTLQRSYGEVGEWVNYKTYTTNQGGVSVNDSAGSGTSSGEINDNQIVYYRFAINAGNYSSGNIRCTLVYGAGIQTGIVRVTEFTSATVVKAQVIQDLAGITATDNWQESEWSSYRGWPSAGRLNDGRLWQAGLDKFYGSISDDYANFDPSVEGDSAAITRSIATGAVESINWILNLQRLIAGTASSEVSIRSSSFDEPLTQTNFTARDASTRGCADIDAVKIDTTGLFVQSGGNKAYEIVYSFENNDYSSQEITRINRSILKPGVSYIAAQRQPDTRVWFLKTDGTAAILLYERAENIMGWFRFTTDGEIETLSSANVDGVEYIYIVVKRIINGTTYRFREKIMQDDDAIGGTDNWISDCSIKITQAASTTITGLSHLEGKQVIVWENGEAVVDQSNLKTVSGGQITGLSRAVTNPIVGLPYNGYIRSVKLAYAAQAGTALTQRKRVDHLGIIAQNTSVDKVKIGKDFVRMTSLSPNYQGKALTSGEVVEDYDYDATSFGGGWSTDSRFCIKMSAPYPAKILGIVVSINTNDRG